MSRIVRIYSGLHVIAIAATIVGTTTQNTIYSRLFPTHIGITQRLKYYVARLPVVDETIIIVGISGEGTCRFNVSLQCPVHIVRTINFI